MHTRFKFVPVARTNVVEDEDKRTGVDRRADNPTCMNSRSSKFCGWHANLTTHNSSSFDNFFWGSCITRTHCQNAAHHLLTESQSSQQPSVHEFFLIMWVLGVQGMSPSWFFRYELTLLSGSTWIGLMSSSLTYKYRLIGRYSKKLLARTQFQFNLHCYDLATLEPHTMHEIRKIWLIGYTGYVW